MGRRLQAGDGRRLSIRVRVFAIAAGIVAVSLLLSGLLTWVLVRQLEEQNAKDSLQRIALVSLAQVNQMSRGSRTPLEVADLLAANVPASSLGGDRLIVLQRQSTRVLYDSDTKLAYGTPVEVVVPDRTLSSGGVTLGGTDYVYGFARVGGPGFGVVVLRSQADVEAQASRHLLPNLLLAGTSSLAIAFILAILMSRAITRPMTELASAAEDIAQGNYSRRVRFTGHDEIGVVGGAFNRMADAVERAREAQREFLANVSHELKTPLTSLIGFSQALVEGRLTPGEQQRAATIVHEESERMLRMSQELLDLARVEAGQMVMTLHQVDLLAMLRQELEMMRPRAENRSLGLDLGAPASMPPVLADAERLQQVLGNLLDNAVKYAPAATTVRVALSAAGKELEVQVANRVGPHPPDPRRMFERFYRADPSRSAAGGVGLGLSISRELATQMGGRLTADVSQDGWLRMRLVLPSANRSTSTTQSLPTMRLRPGLGGDSLSRLEQPPAPDRR